MKYGNCKYCGKKGIIQITGREKNPLIEYCMLINFGSGIHCCSFDHYYKFREEHG